MDNKELIINVLSVLANIILIILCFATAIVKDWWLCLLIPCIFNFKIIYREDNDYE